MRKRSLMVFCLSTLLMVEGCAPVTEIRSLQRSSADPYLAKSDVFNEEKLAYSHQRRCYVYYDDLIVMRETGEKIRDKEEAVERIHVLYTVKDSDNTTREKTYRGLSYIWLVPAEIIFTVVNFVATIPFYPFFSYLKHKEKRESYNNYAQGELLLKEAKYSEARKHFMAATLRDGLLPWQSDIYYKIAKSYQGEGNRELAVQYYQEFIDYSFRQYPDYFMDYEPERKNDLDQLSKEFDDAEATLTEAFVRK